MSEAPTFLMRIGSSAVTDLLGSYARCVSDPFGNSFGQRSIRRTSRPPFRLSGSPLARRTFHTRRGVRSKESQREDALHVSVCQAVLASQIEQARCPALHDLVVPGAGAGDGLGDRSGLNGRRECVARRNDDQNIPFHA